MTKSLKYGIFFISLVCILLLVLFIWFDPFSVLRYNSHKVELEEFEYYDCLVLQTSFQNYKKGFLSKELIDLEVFVNYEDFPDVLDLFADVENLQGTAYELLAEENQKYVLVRPEDASARLKTLEIDGIYYWRGKNLNDYPLCQKRFANFSTQEEYESIAQNFPRYEDKYYRYDIGRILSVYSAGEVIPARAVDRTWLNKSDDYTLLFDRFRKIIQESDLALVMLENPVAYDPQPCQGCMLFVGDEKNVAGLKKVGFDAVGIGNHFGDGGQKALSRTIEIFARNDLPLVGVSDDGIDEASEPVYLKWGQNQIAFFSAEDVARYYWAGIGSGGTNRYSLDSGIDLDKIQKDMQSAKKQSDLVVVMISWGVEYTNKSNEHQQALAHSLIDAGADIIIGSHPHWVQEIEFYKNKPIFYSLGNFVFDQTNDGADAHWSRRNGETRQGVSIELFYDDLDLVAFDILPHKMCGYDQAGGERFNLTHNLAWKILEGEITYAEVDAMDESEGCVWYQPTPIDEKDIFYEQLFDRLMEFSNI